MNSAPRNSGESLFPVFKFDLNMKLISANEAAKPLLEKWRWTVGAGIPSEVLSGHTELFHCILGQKPADLKVDMDGFNIRFSAVPFPEAGYIGIYAYSLEVVEVERNHSEKKQTVTTLINQLNNA